MQPVPGSRHKRSSLRCAPSLHRQLCSQSIANRTRVPPIPLVCPVVVQQREAGVKRYMLDRKSQEPQVRKARMHCARFVPSNSRGMQVKSARGMA